MQPEVLQRIQDILSQAYLLITALRDERRQLVTSAIQAAQNQELKICKSD